MVRTARKKVSPPFAASAEEATQPTHRQHLKEISGVCAKIKSSQGEDLEVLTSPMAIAKKLSGNTPYFAETFNALEACVDLIRQVPLEKIHKKMKGVGEDPLQAVLSIGLMVAAYDLDRGAATSGGRLINGMRLVHKTHEDCARLRSRTVLASMLQEFVAQELISIEAVEQKFGPAVAELTQQMAAVTRVPVTVLPYADGRVDAKGRIDGIVGSWSRADYQFNLEQHTLCHDLHFGTRDRARVCVSKVLTSFWKMIVLEKDFLRNREDRNEKRVADGLLPETQNERLKAEREAMLDLVHMKAYVPLASQLQVPVDHMMEEMMTHITSPEDCGRVRERYMALGFADQNGVIKGQESVLGGIAAKVRACLTKLGYDPDNFVLSHRVKEETSCVIKMTDKQNEGERRIYSCMNPEHFDNLFDMTEDTGGLRLIAKEPMTEEETEQVFLDLVNYLEERGDFSVRRTKNYWDPQVQKDNGYAVGHVTMLVDGFVPVELQVLTANMNEMAHQGGDPKKDHSIHKWYDRTNKSLLKDINKSFSVVGDEVYRRAESGHLTPYPSTACDREKSAVVVCNIRTEIEKLMRGGNLKSEVAPLLDASVKEEKYKVLRFFVPHMGNEALRDALVKVPERVTLGGIMRKLERNCGEEYRKQIQEAVAVVLNGQFHRLDTGFDDILKKVLPHAASITFLTGGDVAPVLKLDAPNGNPLERKKSYTPQPVQVAVSPFVQ